MEKDIVVNSWEELQRELFRGTWNDKLHRFRSAFIYRGLSDKSYDLKASLIRLGGDFAGPEPHLLRNFRKYPHTLAWTGNSVWNWLAVAHHHGLPTRLLDWTFSPFVALHFTTANLEKFDVDGAIWSVNNLESNKYLPDNLKEVIAAEGPHVFTAEILEPVCSSLKELAAFQEKDFGIFLEPPSLEERIVYQFALFSVMSSAEAKMESWLEQYPDLYFRIIIPAGLKWEIRDKLDQANITERVLFPGLNGMSAWLKRPYTTVPEPPFPQTNTGQLNNAMGSLEKPQQTQIQLPQLPKLWLRKKQPTDLKPKKNNLTITTTTATIARRPKGC